MEHRVIEKLAFVLMLAGGCVQSTHGDEPENSPAAAAYPPDSGVAEQTRAADAEQDAEQDADNDTPVNAIDREQTPERIVRSEDTDTREPAPPTVGSPTLDVSNPTLDAPELPALPQLPAMPHPRDGACAFEPVADPAPAVDNAICPDGIARGHFNLKSDADVELLRGCTRVQGNLNVYAAHISSVAALAALRVIEGQLYVTSEPLCTTPSEQCSRPTSPLTRLDGLEALRCLGNGLDVFGDSAHTIGIDALHNLVEIGASLNLRHVEASDVAFASLRRIWGDAYFDSMRNTPRLESIYGRDNGLHTMFKDSHTGCEPTSYCSEGVLGCSVTVSTAYDIEQLSNCEIAVGSILVSGEAAMHLSALSKLRHALSFLYIFGAPAEPAEQPASLDGLQSLQSVADLHITHLPGLTNLDALAHTRVTRLRTTQLGGAVELGEPGKIELGQLPQLQSLRGLNSVTSLRSLTITDCDALSDLSGLDSLQAVELMRIEGSAGLHSLHGAPQLRTLNRVQLISDPNLVDISALSQLSSTNLHVYDLLYLSDFLPLTNVKLSDVHILNMPSLQSLAGLEGLGENPRWIDVQNNPVLEDITALSGVRSAWQIEIRGNDSLRSLDALSGLQSVSVASEIYKNALVPQCEVDALHARIPLLEGSQNDASATCSPVGQP